MSEALTVKTYTAADLAKGGVGFQNKSRFFKPKPDYISLVQNMTKWTPGSGPRPTPGKLRTGAGQEFDEMHLVMLFQPVDWADYYLEGAKDFKPENRLCFSRNIEIDPNTHRLVGGTPDKRAKQPQALQCVGCRKGSWEKYMQTRNKADIPPCKTYVHTMVVDRVTKFVYNLDIKSTSMDYKLKDGFVKAMDKIGQQMMLIKYQTGQQPNLFDFSFKIFSVPQQGGQFYTFGFKDVSLIPETDRAEFGEIFIDFINQQNASVPEEDVVAKAEAELIKEAAAVNAQVTETPSSGPVDGEYVTI